MDKASISVIVPLYKGKKYIQNIINLCENNMNDQNLFFIELILVNDYPEEKIDIEEYQYEQIEVKLINNKQNRGIHASRVVGLQNCHGSYVLFLDQDDIIAHNYFESQLRCIGDKDLVVCRCMNEYKQLYNDTHRFEDVITYEYILNVGCPTLSPGQILIRKEAIPEVWMSNIMQSNCADDYFLWMCMVATNRKFARNDAVVFEYTNDGFNTSSNYNYVINSEREMFSLLKKNNVFDEATLVKIDHMLENKQKERFDLLDKFKKMFFVVNRILLMKQNGINLSSWFNNKKYKKIAIYGISYIGTIIYNEIKSIKSIDSIVFIDRNAEYLTAECKIYKPDAIPDVPDLIILTMMNGTEELQKEIKQKFSVDVISIRTMLDEIDEKNCEYRESNLL